jgi:hypothetical protein
LPQFLAVEQLLCQSGHVPGSRTIARDARCPANGRRQMIAAPAALAVRGAPGMTLSEMSDRGAIEMRQSLAADSGEKLQFSRHDGDRRPSVVSHDGSQEAPQVSAGLLPSIPAMPSVPRAELHHGRPNLLLESGLRHSLGWQDHRKAGPSFVAVRLSQLDRVKVKERFPLTEQGWAAAWRALSGLDAGAPAAIAARLAQMEARRRGAAALVALDAESLRCLRYVTFNGGAGGAPLTKGRAYEMRFLADRIMVCSPRSAEAIVEVPYRDVETVEVSGSSSGMSSGEVAALILALGLLGALLGLFILGLLGFLLGAAVFGLAGALVAAASSKIETIVRLRGRDAELYFLHTAKTPDALRIELSEPLRAIENARAAQAGDLDEPTDLARGSIPDQLSKLASLLQQDLITRDEFEHLKAKLIATS